ncbi:phosphotransferase enzyme family protein [Saccharomonospora xinjiangensis]|uniref:phosphotransferase enzyme family protein n=1 Tax=Saccharomonospora xinjiangensis TaxID=75294 RepID=UPI00350FBD47
MDGRFTRAKLDEVLRRTCVLLGLDHRDATLLRFTNNAVYSLAGDPVVVRIVGSRALRHRAGKVVLVAEHLAAHGVPAVRLFGEVNQPLRVGEHAVTVWHRVRSAGRAATPAELATLLKAVHGLPPPEGLPEWAPLDDVRARVSDAEELSEEDRRFLLQRCALVEKQVAALEFELPVSLVHGDAHPGNVIVGDDGPVLCDFDSSCVGPAEWDLIPLAVGHERFRDPPHRYAQLSRHYGFDVTAWAGFPVLRAVRELKLTTSVLPIARSHPAVREELARRLADLRDGRSRTRWFRYR